MRVLRKQVKTILYKGCTKVNMNLNKKTKYKYADELES